MGDSLNQTFSKQVSLLLNAMVEGQGDQACVPYIIANPTNPTSNMTFSPLANICRVTAGCNAWFYCTDAGGCADWQSGQPAAAGDCLLLTADTRPQQEPVLEDVTAPGGFFSYHAGYLIHPRCRLWELSCWGCPLQQEVLLSDGGQKP